MSTESNLENNGKLSEFPAVELLNEAVHANLSGTFRFENDLQKIAVYLSEGEIIYAAANTRNHRLAVKFVQWNFIAQKDLAGLENLNDVELAARLVAAGKITPLALEMCQNRQVAEIVAAALGWTDGAWVFNPLVRVREDLFVAVDAPLLLTESARRLPADFVRTRFHSEMDSFMLAADSTEPTFNLSPEEAFVMSRIAGGLTNCETIAGVSGLPLERICKAIYVLWLGGLLRRFNYAVAFDESKIRQIRSARLTAKQLNAAAPTVAAESKAELEPESTPIVIAPDAPVESSEDAEKRFVTEYLTRIETARNHYDVLNVSNQTSSGDIKQIYFRLAKQFHPDKFYHGTDKVLHSKLQHAFSKLSQAYETLKDLKTRELYDFKLQKEGAGGNTADISRQSPAEVFELGITQLQAGNYGQAVALLTRAIQLAPNSAEYHARFGQALAMNPNFRHKAEGELQTAIRLEGKNPEWRLLLAEFYLAANLQKRAEGELNRLLAIAPDNAAARQMLSNL